MSVAEIFDEWLRSSALDQKRKLNCDILRNTISVELTIPSVGPRSASWTRDS